MDYKLDTATKLLVHFLGCENGIMTIEETFLKFSGHADEEGRAEASD